MQRMPATERRRLLIEAAQRVIVRDGVSAATTRAVAAEAAMPLASFHYVFESQQELMRELILTVAADESSALASVDAAAAGDLTVASLLDGFLDYVVSNRGSQLAAFEINHYALRTPELAHLAGVRAAAAGETVGQGIALCEAAAGPIQCDRDVLVHLVMVLADGLVTVFLSDGDERAARRTVALVAPLIEELAFGRKTRS